MALSADFSVSERNRILSRASEALDINSRRKICAHEGERSCDYHVERYKRVSHVTACKTKDGDGGGEEGGERREK